MIVDVHENDDGKLEPIFAARPPEPIAVELPVGEQTELEAGMAN